MTAADLVLALDAEMKGVEFGEVTIRVQVRAGQAWRAEISRSRSLLLETDSQSVGEAEKPAPRCVVAARRPGECDRV